MAAVGANLKRGCWVDQERFKIYPNMSVLLVGPSGLGKDTSINEAESILKRFPGVPIIGGRTAEAICAQMAMLSKPAACVIFAPELSDFFGAADYQKTMLVTMTDILSTKDIKDISLKSGIQHIYEPTLTIIGGSTPQWLHKAMPETAMDGGFYPRFIIACEDSVKRHVPIVKDLPQAEIEAANDGRKRFFDGLDVLYKEFSRVGEFTLEPAAKLLFNSFYVEREKYFSKQASAYAHRCRDHCLRLALISALCCHRRTITEADVGFGVGVCKYIGGKVDEALTLPSPEAAIAKKAMKLLPATKGQILRELGQRHTKNQIEQALLYLEGAELVTVVSGTYRKA